MAVSIGNGLNKYTMPMSHSMYFKKPSNRQLSWTAGLSLVLFGLLAVWVTLDNTPAIDTMIIKGLRVDGNLADPLGPGWLEEGMRDITALGSNWVLLYLTGLGALLLYLVGHARLAMQMVAGILLALAATFALKHGFTRPRPDLVGHGTRVFTSSFPSAHAMMSAITYFTLAAASLCVTSLRNVRRLFFIVAGITTLFIGFSRVYLGVHWPTDILAGWLGAAVWVIIWYRIAVQNHKAERS